MPEHGSGTPCGTAIEKLSDGRGTVVGSEGRRMAFDGHTAKTTVLLLRSDGLQVGIDIIEVIA